MFDIIRSNPSKSLMVMLIPALMAVIFRTLVLDYSLERDDLRLRIGLYPTGGGPNLLRPDAPAGEGEFVLISLAE